MLFTLKMFAEGPAIIPDAGMQALPDALADRHPDALVRLETPVESIVIEDGKATGVIAGGETVAASAVVVATDGPAARALTGIESIPTSGIGCATVYLAGSRDPGIGKTLLLNGSGFGGVNHIAPLSPVKGNISSQPIVLITVPGPLKNMPLSTRSMSRVISFGQSREKATDWVIRGVHLPHCLAGGWRWP